MVVHAPGAGDLQRCPAPHRAADRRAKPDPIAGWRTVKRPINGPAQSTGSAYSSHPDAEDPLPSRERERQIDPIAASSAASRAVTAAARSAASNAPRRMSIAQPVAEPDPQPFAQHKRSHSRILGTSEKLDQLAKKTRTLRRRVSCNVTPEDGSANGSASGCGKRAAMTSGRAA